MELDPVLLSRLQFAFVISFHAIFPAFSIGMAAYIALLEGFYYGTRKAMWRHLAEFWTRIFAIAFAMGVVSGIVMSFQFGTNWSNFSQAVANFFGPALSYEVLTAFFLEATFLGVLLFGRDKVPPGVHLLAAIMVAVGTLISTFWILSANSWMHTPAGTELRDGIFQVTSWSAAIFNPSFPYRLVHMTLASFLTGGFVVAGTSAYFLVRNRAVDANRKALSMTMWLLLIAAPAQLVVGDLHGLNTAEYQPMKVAAMEGVWETERGAPMLLFALPDQENQENDLALGIPNVASLILTHQWDGKVAGLAQIPRDEQPPVAIVFWAFRVMVGLGVLMIAFALWALWLRYRNRLYDTRAFLQGLRLMAVAPFIAVLAGWFVTEIGRAPWLVYGVMSQSEGVTPSLSGGVALASLLGYMAVYAVIFVAGVYYLTRVVQAGIEGEETQAFARQYTDQPSRPMSAVHTSLEQATSTTGRQ